jgi:uncharacterized protein (DUF2345 family)
MKLHSATRALLVTAASAGVCLSAYAADAQRKEAKIDIAAGGTVNIVNGGTNCL